MRDDMKRNAGPDGMARNPASERVSDSGLPLTNKESEALKGGADNAAKPVKRHKIGSGSYEDPADERARKRKPGKTGRPGR
jgi:excinuclease ABC subunit B